MPGLIAACSKPAYVDPMIVTRLDADGKLALTKELLDALDLKPGDEIGLHVEEGQVVMVRHAPDDEVDEELGMTYGEIRAMLAEAEEGETVSIEEAFADLRAYAALRRAAAE
jgi:bifunctional DNA-binding transcriptional regulator/antitoxin component of YhaV-PrlF toxin-antitoxin module